MRLIPLESRVSEVKVGRGRFQVRRRHRASLPGRDRRERTTTGEGLSLIPLESIDRRRYRPYARDVRPPWLKRVYRHPEDEES